MERKLSLLIGSGLQCKIFSEENNYYAYTSSLSQATIAFPSLPHPFPLRINYWKIYLTTTVNKTHPSFLWAVNRLLIFILFIYNEINFLTILNPSLCSPRCNIGQISKFRCTLLSWRSLPKSVVAAFTTLGVSFPKFYSWTFNNQWEKCSEAGTWSKEFISSLFLLTAVRSWVLFHTALQRDMLTAVLITEL